MKFRLLVLVLALVLTGCYTTTPLQTLPTVAQTTPEMTTTVPETTPESTTTAPETTPEPTSPPEPADEDFVPIRDYLPDAVILLPYSTADNFTGQVIYDFSQPWLRYGTVKKLMAVQQALASMGMKLMIWDGFRPVSAQFQLWAICPDPTYVSDPNVGFSSHSRGNTVDLTLVYTDGSPVTMPTGFDDFSPLADRDYSDCPPDAAANALLLENLMKQAGFRGYRGEWWHFTDLTDYPVEETFLPQDP